MTDGPPRTPFQLPEDLRFNTAPIEDPTRYAKEREVVAWLYLNGEEFESMEGGMSYAQVREAVSRSAIVVSDPPRVLDLALARAHVEALDALPRPTLVSCRRGPRASAVAYMYAGLKSGAEPDAVLAEAARQGAPFSGFEEYERWVRDSILALRSSPG